MTKNRYKFTFGDKAFTLTLAKDNLLMEEVERLAKSKYEALKQKLPQADTETLAIVLAINSLTVQLEREKAFAELERELAELKASQAPEIRMDQTSLFEDE